MGARVSAEMVKARQLVQAGATAYAAAKATGLTVGAISRTQWYIDHVAAQPKTLSPGAEKARALVVDQGMTAYAAAKALGIAQSTISRAGWYRSHIDDLVNKFPKETP